MGAQAHRPDPYTICSLAKRDCQVRCRLTGLPPGVTRHSAFCNISFAPPLVWHNLSVLETNLECKSFHSIMNNRIYFPLQSHLMYACLPQKTSRITYLRVHVISTKSKHIKVCIIITYKTERKQLVPPTWRRIRGWREGDGSEIVLGSRRPRVLSTKQRPTVTRHW